MNYLIMGSGRSRFSDPTPQDCNSCITNLAIWLRPDSGERLSGFRERLDDFEERLDDSWERPQIGIPSGAPESP